ncbi:CocE/NonD family hydrolase [Caballeronia sp. S22]|uniref:CocE/NonD family hydrolase n=1 Tax=Caballeronia sp. S22 TaxID=3137182 RepID=UPI003530ED2F
MTEPNKLQPEQMVIEWDVPIAMDDGVVLRADIFRPAGPGQYPAILSYGPYGKGLSFQDGYSTAWKILEDRFPDAVQGSSNQYQNWEVVDPEKWVPDGYVCVRVDSRGAGRSEGVIDCASPRETQDLYDCIEWAAKQEWCTGKIGLNGVSYFAANQWRVAALQPPSLAAICIWEGYSDRYRDLTYHGGIRSTFPRDWAEMQVQTVQHGRGEKGPRSRLTGALVCGDETLSDEELAKRRVSDWKSIVENPLDGFSYRERSPDFSKIKVPLLSAGNWGGHGLHLRGNIEGFVRSASEDKWLELHDGEHWAEFYTDYGVQLQKGFLNYYLKGESNGWTSRPRVQYRLRDVHGKFEDRTDSAWPLSNTVWNRLYLDLVNKQLSATASEADVASPFDAMGDGIDFLTAPLPEPLEIAGPLAAKLFVSSSTDDADLFLVARVFAPDGKEVLFRGALDPNAPLAQGWLRVSHRKTDPALSEPYRPYHTHDTHEPLVPGLPVEVDVEIWPTSIAIPAGYRLGLSVRGRDYEHNLDVARLSNMKFPMRGCGPFIHNDEQDRPAATFAGTTTLHASKTQKPFLLIPTLAKSR